jgi:hypothetical protein
LNTTVLPLYCKARVKSTNPFYKQIMKTIFKLSFALFSLLVVAVIVSNAYEVSILDVAQGYFIVGLVLFIIRMVVITTTPGDYTKKPSGLAYGVALEFWESTIAEYLMREYPWIMRAKDKTQYVNGSVVHIPQSGVLPGGVRNRKNYPAPVIKRTDSDILYTLDEVSTNPTHIKHAETVELSYDKVGSVLSDHIKQLNFLSAFNIIYRWLGKNNTMLDLNAANIVRTTGANIATHLTGATGNRKTFMVADVASAKTVLINQTKRELNPGRRALVLDENLYNQLKSDAVLDNNQKYDLVGAVFQNGDLVKIHGFDIIRTDVMPRFSNAGTPLAKDPLTDADDGVPYAASYAATDNACAMVVDFDFVHVSKGSIEMFETLKDAQMQGDMYSALIRIGGSRERLDQAGVVAIVQVP